MLRIFLWNFSNQHLLAFSKIAELYIPLLLSWINKNSWHHLSEQQLTISIIVSLSFQISEKQLSGLKMWNNVGYVIGPTKLKVEICSMFSKIISIIKLTVLHSLAILRRQLSAILFVVYVTLIIISRWAA